MITFKEAWYVGNLLEDKRAGSDNVLDIKRRKSILQPHNNPIVGV